MTLGHNAARVVDGYYCHTEEGKKCIKNYEVIILKENHPVGP
jgi:hypothetical protein